MKIDNGLTENPLHSFWYQIFPDKAPFKSWDRQEVIILYTVHCMYLYIQLEDQKAQNFMLILSPLNNLC
jgi:hypothetical protein